MEDEAEAEREPAQISLQTADMAAYMSQNIYDALRALVPPTEKELAIRLPFITNLGGRAPHWSLVYMASLQWKIEDEIIKDGANGDIDVPDLDPAYWVERHMPSLQMARSKQVVQLAQVTNVQNRPRSLRERLFGR